MPGLLQDGGWVAVYGAFMTDDGGFASEGDEKVGCLLPVPQAISWDSLMLVQFHQRFMGIHPDFGLRRIPDVQNAAKRYGFVLEKRIPMPAGNWMVLFRLQGPLLISGISPDKRRPVM